MDGKVCLSPGSVSGCFYVSMPALSEEYSPVVLAGGGGCCGIPPGRGVVRYSASVCTADG